MLPQAVDFRAEADELHALLATLSESDWDQPTLFKQWTVNDIVRHLHDGDLMAAASVAGADPFAAFRAERQALVDTGLTRIEATRRRLDGLAGRRLLDKWHATMSDLCDKLSAMPSDARLKWAGPDMGVRMFATARQMETWAHGQAIYDLMGSQRTPTDRLRNIAEIGVRTYGWTFANRGLPVPGAAPNVCLTVPSGAVWEWNERTLENSVEGDALSFCQVVTQTRNVTDTALTVTGEPARANGCASPNASPARRRTHRRRAYAGWPLVKAFPAGMVPSHRKTSYRRRSTQGDCSPTPNWMVGRSRGGREQQAQSDGGAAARQGPRCPVMNWRFLNGP